MTEDGIYFFLFSETQTRESYQGNTFFLFSELQTLDTCQAMFLPVGASISLLIMFLFFDSLQVVFAVFTASEFTCFLFELL